MSNLGAKRKWSVGSVEFCIEGMMCAIGACALGAE